MELVIRGPFKAFDLDRTVLVGHQRPALDAGRVPRSRLSPRDHRRAGPGAVAISRPSRPTTGCCAKRWARHRVLPRIAAKNQAPRIGFLLPIASFGGVEKVAYAMARVLARLGYETHLYILGKSSCEMVFDPAGFHQRQFPDGRLPAVGWAASFRRP